MKKKFSFEIGDMFSVGEAFRADGVRYNKGFYIITETQKTDLYEFYGQCYMAKQVSNGENVRVDEFWFNRTQERGVLECFQ